MKFLFVFFAFLSLSASTLAQPLFFQKKNQKKDTIPKVKYHDSIQVFTMKSKVKLWKIGKKVEIWSPNGNGKVWKLDNKTQIWTISDNLKFWLSNATGMVWEINPKTQAVKSKTPALAWKINDTLTVWTLSDTIKMTFHRDTAEIWNVENRTHYWKKNKEAKIVLNDSTTFWNVNDTSKLWLQKDSSALWKFSRIPKMWKPSSKTFVWTINATTEFWKTGSGITVWTRKDNKGDWTLNKQIKPLIINDSISLWNLEPQLKVVMFKNEPHIWLPDFKTKIWVLSDSVRVWKEIPPPPKILVSILKNQKKNTAKHSALTNDVHCWIVNDETKVWQVGEQIELWNLNYNAKNWSVNDSTNIWALSEKMQLTLFGDELKIWTLNDTTKKWRFVSKPKFWRPDEKTKIWKINENTKLEKISPDKAGKVWSVNPYVKIAKIQIKQIQKLGDSICIWKISSDAHFWIYNDITTLWYKDNTSSIWIVNDSTQFWRINDNLRISQMNDSITFWWSNPKYPEKVWEVLRNVNSIEINDSTELWELEHTSRLIRTGKKIELWKLDERTKIITINDSTKLFTVLPPPPLQKIPLKERLKHWEFSGDGALSFSHNYQSYWGDSKTSLIQYTMMAILQMRSKYTQKNINYENSLEFRHERYQTDEEEKLRKGQDKLEFSTKLGYRAFKNWYYSGRFTFTSQLFNGYNYPNDSVVASRFMSPGFLSYDFGLDYRPSSHFSLMLVPASYNLVYVLDTALTDLKKRYNIEKDRKVRETKGGKIITEINVDIFKVMNLWTKLELSSDYMKNFQNIDVKWDFTLSLKIGKFLTTSLRTNLLYDDDVKVKVMTKEGSKRVPEVIIVDGKKVNHYAPKIQFSEVWTVGFSFKF